MLFSVNLLIFKRTLSTLSANWCYNSLGLILCIVSWITHHLHSRMIIWLLLHRCLVFHGCDLHWVHLFCQYFLERGSARYLLPLLLREWTHLGLNISEVLVLGVICIYPSIILKCLHGSLILRTVHLAQVQVSCTCLSHAWEESCIELTITSISTLPARVRPDEGVSIAILVLLSSRLEMITVVFETRVAAHSVPWGHAIRLVLSIKWAPIRTVILLARILALVQEVVGHSLVHDASLSTDKGVALGYKRVILMVLAWVANELAISDNLFRNADINVVGHHVVWDCRAEFIFHTLPRLAQTWLVREIWGAVNVLFGCTGWVLSLGWRLVCVLKGAVEEVCRVSVKLWLRGVHHGPVIVLNNVDIYHACLNVWPSLLCLQLLHDFYPLTSQVFLVTIKVAIIMVDEALRRVVLLLRTAANVVSIEWALLIIVLLLRQLFWALSLRLKCRLY